MSEKICIETIFPVSLCMDGQPHLNTRYYWTG